MLLRREKEADEEGEETAVFEGAMSDIAVVFNVKSTGRYLWRGGDTVSLYEYSVTQVLLVR